METTRGLYLFFAGMSMHPRQVEQIGLAISEDGSNFRRPDSTGLLIERRDHAPWCNVHVCNPTVVREPSGDGWLMFYQGVGRADAAGDARLSTSLALAESNTLTAWQEPEAPFLTVDAVLDVFGSVEGADAVGVIEPSVVHVDGKWHMWFVVVHPRATGNALMHAHSSDLKEWTVDPEPVTLGERYGSYNIHYPQVVQGEGRWELWFTLIDRRYGGHGIFRASSSNLTSWSDVHQVLPEYSEGVPTHLRPTSAPVPLLRISGREGRPSLLIRKAWNRLARKLTYWLGSGSDGRGRAVYGYAHPHVIDWDGARHLYFHYCNTSPQALTLDIGLAMLSNDGVTNIRPVLAAGETGAWDDFFVADPFIVAT
jgi:predicted GH43/DUF377 family glycosyl hydrolase